MQYRSLKNLSDLIRKNVADIPRVDVVAGIPKSGMLAASMIATLTQQPLASVNELLERSWRIPRHGGMWTIPSGINHVLLVDDSTSGGETMNRARRDLQAYYDVKITTLVAYRKPNSPPVDIALETLEADRVFEWNWFKHKRHLSTAVLDIDGVISTPTTPGYRLAGKPLFVPRHKVLALATGRWEVEDTIQQMTEFGVQYGALFTSTDRRHGRETKAEAARMIGAKWIVESDLGQAVWLRNNTELPVLCIESNEMR